MSSKRTPIQRTRTPSITPAAVEAFKRAIELKDAAQVEAAANRTGVQGPIQSAHTDAWCTCHRECGLKSWQLSPLDATGTAPRAFDNPEGWHRARELRIALLAAAGLKPEGE
jgi:hypothetical protein